MNLSGKTVVFLGSSVTWGDQNVSMCEYIAETAGCTVVKWAVSGTTLSDINEKSYVRRLDAQIGGQTACDCFVCQLSTNDASKNLPLGEIADGFDPASFDVSTTVGAMEYIISRVREKWNCPILFYTGTYYEKPAYQAMVDALLQLADKWNIGVIDLWNDPEMRAVTPEQYNAYMRDPIHPSLLGYREWWMPKFTEAIQNALAGTH